MNKGIKERFEWRKKMKLLRCTIHKPQEFEEFAGRYFDMFDGTKGGGS